MTSPRDIQTPRGQKGRCSCRSIRKTTSGLFNSRLPLADGLEKAQQLLLFVLYDKRKWISIDELKSKKLPQYVMYSHFFYCTV